MAIGGGLTQGEMRKVSEKAQVYCRMYTNRYDAWRQREGREHTLEMLEINVIDYLDFVAAEGGKLAEFETSMAAIIHFTPVAVKAHEADQ